MSGKRRKPFAVRVTAGWAADGKQIYRFLSYHASKAEAIIALAEYNKAPYDLDANNITFAEIYERYTSENTFSDGLTKLNKTCFNHSKPLHDIVFKNLRKAHFQGVINTLETPTAKANVASFFRKLGSYALENDIIHKDYAQFVVTPSKNRKTKKTPFRAEEVMLFWDHIGNVNAEIMLMLCYSGMRISELLTLKKEQVNLGENYIITGSKTEAGKDRYIPIHPRIKPLLEKHMENKTEWAIVNMFGDKPIRYDSFHAKRWSKLKTKLQLRDELTIHSTRHFFVSELHKHGADKIAVQKIVGHKGDDVTDDTYTHISNQLLHETVLLLT
jgi:integrase